MTTEKKMTNILYSLYYIWIFIGSSPIGLVWYSVIYFTFWLFILNGLDKRYENI